MPKITEKPGALGAQPAKVSGLSGQPARGAAFGQPRPGRADIDTILNLLREYADKFQRWSVNAETAKLNRLMSLGAELASRASQLIEFGGLDDLTRFELKIRLEEFEFVLLGAKAITPKSA